jgi:hypothetical protein
MRIARKKYDETMGADFQSSPWRLDHLEGYSICVKWMETSGSLAGTLKLQASNNAFVYESGSGNLVEWDTGKTPGYNPDATWADIAASSVAVSGDGSYFWNVSDSYYSAVRVVFTHTSGDGTLEGFGHAQGDQA